MDILRHLLEQARHQWLNIGSVVFLLILIPIRRWTRNIAFEKIKKKFDNDEYILIEPVIPFFVEFFGPFLFGGATLELILSPDKQPINLIISILFTLIMLFGIFLLSCSKYGVTNKRVFYIPSFDFMYKFKNFSWFNFFEVGINDIKNISKKKYLGYFHLEIETKTNEKPIRLMFENIDEIKTEVNNQILLPHS